MAIPAAVRVHRAGGLLPWDPGDGGCCGLLCCIQGCLVLEAAEHRVWVEYAEDLRRAGSVRGEGIRMWVGQRLVSGVGASSRCKRACVYWCAASTCPTVVVALPPLLLE